jgi:hypothetical protein
MPWRGEAYPGELITLGWEVAQWIQDLCVIPDRDDRGRPFALTREQLIFLARYYAIDEHGRWIYLRGGQLIRPQKWGKGPLAAAIICAEAAGPAVFDGWNAEGEPVGRPWATPHIQITACSEDQTANTWRALQPMIELGELGRSFIPDSGLTRMNLPGGGLIEPVTASARSRLGQRITFACEDETHAWVESNHGWWLADNQRRNLSGMHGRFLETSNAYAPEENSVAQRTQSEPGVYIDDVDGGAGSIRNKAERRRVMRRVYGDSLIDRGGWIDLNRIDAEIEALLEHDPSQAERFFLNRKLSTEGAAFDPVQWAKLARPSKVPRDEVVALGVDGARYDDAIAVVATHVKSGYQWPVIILEKPEFTPADYEHDLNLVDGAVREVFGIFTVWRAYCDDQYIGKLIDDWQNRFGHKRVVTWHTNRPRQIAWAVRNYEQAVASGDVHHDGDPVFARHIANARKRKLTVLDDRERQMHTLTKDSIRSPRKIDAAMAAILSWEARADCIAMGAVDLDPGGPRPSKPSPKRYEPDRAPPAAALVGAPAAGPMSI